MSDETLVMMACVEDHGGPLLFANLAEYEAWSGIKKMPDAKETVLRPSPARTLLWRTIATGERLDASCWIDETKNEILYLQIMEGMKRDEAVAAIRNGEELPVGSMRLDAAFVVAAAAIPASKLKVLPSKLMKQKVGGRPLSQLCMKRSDDDVGSVFPARAGIWRVTRVQVSPECSGLWIRWAAA